VRAPAPRWESSWSVNKAFRDQPRSVSRYSVHDVGTAEVELFHGVLATAGDQSRAVGHNGMRQSSRPMLCRYQIAAVVAPPRAMQRGFACHHLLLVKAPDDTRRAH
jgi:hypothetical protein